MFRAGGESLIRSPSSHTLPRTSSYIDGVMDIEYDQVVKVG